MRCCNQATISSQDMKKILDVALPELERSHKDLCKSRLEYFTDLFKQRLLYRLRIDRREPTPETVRRHYDPDHILMTKWYRYYLEYKEYSFELLEDARNFYSLCQTVDSLQIDVHTILTLLLIHDRLQQGENP